MKTLMTNLLVLLASSAALAAPAEIQTRIANDYVLFDAVSEAKISQATNLPGILGSRLKISIKGDLAVRGCQYTGFGIFLQPKSTEGGLNDELYNVTVLPLYQGSGVEVSFLPCQDVSLGIQEFHTTIEIGVHEWLGWSQRKWVYTFLGTGGIKLKILQIIYRPSSGWSLTEI